MQFCLRGSFVVCKTAYYAVVNWEQYCEIPVLKLAKSDSVHGSSEPAGGVTAPAVTQLNYYITLLMKVSPTLTQAMSTVMAIIRNSIEHYLPEAQLLD